MAADHDTIARVEALAGGEAYEHGFVTDIEQEFAEKGLNEAVIRFISAKKDEPEWMLDWRLAAFRRWQKMPMPDWAKLNVPPIDYQNAYYYAAPKVKKELASLDEVDPEILRVYEKLGIPIGIHAGSSFRHPVTSLGWPSFYMDDYAAQSQGFQSQLTSLITEGVFAKHPGLKVVMIESGVTWLPGYMWRLSKFWRGLRFEVPWVDRPPLEIVRDHVRLTIQPFDAPENQEIVTQLIDQLQSDDLLL